ncbi:hypothetical protein KC669_01050 [Candidatus Dojkabacteria bacterium]|uniref:Uncharacterized protein n=1 Tax=Candidatus Dojkabacteria bacterium TaxID=2099670 RepID=A0A955L9L0_9BACT|nr:hypothetical protein [Candidatus Dojkabacteria bacterium]
MEKHLSNILDITESVLGLFIFFSIAAVSAYGVVLLNPTAKEISGPRVAGLSTTSEQTLNYTLKYDYSGHLVDRDSYNGFDTISINIGSLNEGTLSVNLLDIENKTPTDSKFQIEASIQGHTGGDVKLFLKANKGYLYSLDKLATVDIKSYQTNTYELVYIADTNINFSFQVDLKIAPVNL